MTDAAQTDDLNEFLRRAGLVKRGAEAVWTPLAGGVSSDIWRVKLPGETVCVKRALARLKGEADWRAPVERNAYEWEWFNFVHRNYPEIVPPPVAQSQFFKSTNQVRRRFDSDGAAGNLAEFFFSSSGLYSTR